MFILRMVKLFPNQRRRKRNSRRITNQISLLHPRLPLLTNLPTIPHLQSIARNERRKRTRERRVKMSRRGRRRRKKGGNRQKVTPPHHPASQPPLPFPSLRSSVILSRSRSPRHLDPSTPPLGTGSYSLIS